MNYYLGIDLGTSSCKLLLCNETGTVLRTAIRAYKVFYPHPGWSEQNPEDWWGAVVSGIRELTQTTDKYSFDICGIAVAGQMHGLVILDESDRVIRPCILWNDCRTANENEYLNTVVGTEFLAEKTGNISFTGFTAPKLLWIRNHEPQNFRKIKKIMLPKDYINYRLTGIHACDYSDASGTLLLDVEHRKWSKEMFDICGIHESQLPKLFESYQPIGTILPEVAEMLALPSRVIVAAGAGDNEGAAIGTGTVGDRKCNISIGTSGTVFISSENFHASGNHALHTFCHADGSYHLMGCILSAASCNQWFCGSILRETDYNALQKEISPEMLGKGDVFFLPYLMGERCPANDSDATGVFLGLRPDVTRAEMLAAVLEGVCFAIRDCVELAKQMGIRISCSSVSGGGAKSHLWLTILSNVLGINLYLPETEEGPALGAAMLAIAASREKKEHFKRNAPIIKRIYCPDVCLTERYEKKYQRYTKIYPNMKKLFKEIKEKP